MRELPPALAAALASGATTLCWCWRITPRAAPALGFTDHDRDLVFEGTTFEAASGFTASEIRDSVGLSVDDLEVESALTSDRLSEASLAAGDFDDAAVEIFRVDWSEPGSRILVRRGSLGEVRRSGTGIIAEVRGLAQKLQQTQGRVFQYGCDAELGDARCGVDLESPLYRASATVLAGLGDRGLATDDLSSFEDGWFTRGLLTFTGGLNAGRAVEIKLHAKRAADATLERADRHRRHLCRHCRLRQAACHLPSALCQYGQLPRLSAHARQRLHRDAPCGLSAFTVERAQRT